MVSIKKEIIFVNFRKGGDYMPQGEKQKEVIEKRLKKLTIEPSQLQILDEFRRLPPVSKRDPDGVRERLIYYFNACQQYEIFPSVESLALCLGVSRQVLLRWSADSTSQSGQLVSRAKEMIGASLTQGSLSGSIPFVYSIFLQKSNFQYREKDDEPQEVPTNAEDAAAIEDKVNQSGLVWSESLQDYVFDVAAHEVDKRGDE
jgi:hypothetical protein